MLTQKIREHNYLNGFKFVIVEFGFFICFILPFTLYYLVHKNFLYGIIGLGLIANFVVVIVFALRSVFKHEISIGINKLYNKKMREEINVNYPNLSKDTFILFISLILPFSLAIVVCIEQLTSKKHHK